MNITNVDVSKIRLLKKKLVLTEAEACRRYAETGMVIYYQELKDEKGKWLIEAETGTDNYGYHNFDNDGELECLNKCFSKYIEKAERINISQRHYLILAPDDFYSKPVARKIKYWHGYYEMYFGEEESQNMKVWTGEKDGFTIYLGTSCEENDVDVFLLMGDELDEFGVHHITPQSYSNYIKDVKQYWNNKREMRKTPPIVSELRNWIKTTPYEEFEQAICERVVGQSAVSIILASIYNYISAKANGKTSKMNTLVAAPSGFGKTETYRAIKEYFREHVPGLPVSLFDVSRLTEEGIIGPGPQEVIADLFEHENTNGVGIVWMDEFDKKLVPSISTRGDGNANAQAQLLTLVEGCIVKKEYRKDNLVKSVDTNNTLFIASGSFNECRKTKGEVIKRAGFESENEGGAEHYTPITKQDVIDLGASYELLGRFPLFINFGKLSDGAVNIIIDKEIEKLHKNMGIFIRISDEFRNELRKSANSEYGCRQISSMLNETIMPAYIAALRKGDVKMHKIWVRNKGNAILEPSALALRKNKGQKSNGVSISEDDILIDSI